MKALLFANTAWYLFNFRRSLGLHLRELGHEVLLVSPPDSFGPKLEELGFRWIPAPMARRSLNPVRELALLAWLRDLMIRERVDLVHGFTIKCAVYGSLAARAAAVHASINAVAGMGYVFTSQAWRARLLRPVVGMLLRLALNGRNSRLILQNPDDVALFIESRLVEQQRIRMIPGSGVDCRRFVPAAERSGGPLRVLLPCRLLWDKGISEFAAAARMLRGHGAAIEFLLAGEPDPGNPASVPDSVVQGWVAEGVLEWLGHVSDMPALFSTVDVVVLPSYREGLPKGLIEAAASGLPLITTDVPGCREVVTHEVEGLLVPAKDAEALADAIQKLAGARELRVRLGHAAREKALARFDERIVIAQTLAVYGELVALETGAAAAPGLGNFALSGAPGQTIPPAP